MRLQTRIKLWKLRLRQRRSDRIFNLLVRESGKLAADCSDEQWYGDAIMDEIEIEAAEKKAISDELLYEAQRLYLPTPSHDDKQKWDSDHSLYSPTRYLTPEAMTELRGAIRKERAEQRVVFEWWLKVLGGAVGILTGLIGALIGLVAIWKK
jgi:CRISPR/Cas system CSM-associated protein Csm4 (group 5 of RAMP superfamily)